MVLLVRISDSDLTNLINVELVDECIRQLKLGKACGPDGLMAEHLLFAHPLLVIHLCALFRAMITSSCVPDGYWLWLRDAGTSSPSL